MSDNKELPYIREKILEKHYANYSKRIAYPDNVLNAMDEYSHLRDSEIEEAMNLLVKQASLCIEKDKTIEQQSATIAELQATIKELQSENIGLLQENVRNGLSVVFKTELDNAKITIAELIEGNKIEAKAEKYSWQKNNTGGYFVVHNESGIIIAEAYDAEKAHFLATVASQYKEPDQPISSSDIEKLAEAEIKEDSCLAMVQQFSLKDLMDYGIEKFIKGYKDAQANVQPNMPKGIIEALKWYQEIAESAERYTGGFNTTGQTALMVELSLDGGKKAKSALSNSTQKNY